METSDKIKKLRAKLNLSQQELAKSINASQSSISQWENDFTEPGRYAREALNQLCKSHNIKLKF